MGTFIHFQSHIFSMTKKSIQLQENFSTASGRLVKDILWSLLVKNGQTSCFHCETQMTRDTFSIEHKIPWQDSQNPRELFFDIANISFSHKSCNCSKARRYNKVYKDEQEGWRVRSKRKWDLLTKVEQKESRRKKYLAQVERHKGVEPLSKV